MTHPENSDSTPISRLRLALREIQAGQRPPLDEIELAGFAKEIRPDAETTIEITEADGEPLIVVRAVKRLHAPFSSLASLKGLSPRELEVAKLIAEGMTNREIARQLGIQIGTVKDHVHNILDTLKVRSRQGIVALVATEVAENRRKSAG